MAPGTNRRACVLVTGGAGYIGSHAVVELINSGYDAVIVDNLSNAYRESINRVEEITGSSIPFYELDILDKEELSNVFEKHEITHVMHFAGSKAIGESCQVPLMYYNNNLLGAIALFNVMKKYQVKNLVFSSSAAVYGVPQYLPIDEKHPTGGCTSPYGRTKLFIEEMIKDICHSDKWNAVLLRYFNPIGAHISGKIGEDPSGHPNNLMPYISQVSVGRRSELSIFGNDYDTPDGTALRDYIHVVDLAKGHVKALKKLEENCGLKYYNLGIGRSYSVLEIVKEYEKASGRQVPYKIVSRRVGDVPILYSDPALAEAELDWKAVKDLKAMCEDTWRWQSLNPHGMREVISPS
ncbi:UDP-glucose 4-epimerase-like isoform X8 [Lingula anatina]|uniref:UDP-glucose 4-epimerase n=1 Tax=Lingula anatina TaxID=7574 RepID=A0A1S3I3Z2_LINAN|nr:UDP-glucose 4-epimerase-like isoform X8 [Lingula anatina]XP_013392985.1 UDP-glucose 4-epimerase-like isoform X8 [Lingula anatina]XP_023931453.1 UDP-glucose 4-epimerase-like isoform X8 [Lingula anatina]|eukprot:XP_013392984.1 UDP-glucose 4-epimerase-like isoform X8 [Lingula anatina]